MKSLKSLLPFLLVVFVLAGCKTDDLEKDIDALTDRVTSLEAQVSLLNENLNALRVFVDGNKTITGYTLSNGTYTVTLSDGETITLTQGQSGTVSTPDISINDAGNWVINGTDSGVKAEGDNGITPQFRINSEGYWEVNTTGSTTDGWTNVLDENGDPVRATTDESIATGDQFFTSVEETTVNGTRVLQVTLASGGTYSLPIVESLLCQIVDPEGGFSNGVWTIGYGETVTTSVLVKGDNYIVTAPAGWTASVEITNEETGEGTLTVTAPVQSSTLSRAAVADNSKDLVIQVNKGITWAVDKIQVEAERVITSYYELFNAGEPLTFGGFELKNADYSAGDNFIIKQVTEDEAISLPGIYFVRPGVSVTWVSDAAIANTFIIGDDPRAQTSSLTIDEGHYIRLNGGSEVDGTFVCANITFNARAANYSMGITNGLDNLIFDNCKVVLSSKSLFYTGNDVEIGNITFANSKIDVSQCTTQIFNMSSIATHALNANMINNVIYANPQISGRAFFNYPNCNGGNVVLENNTFINVAVGTFGFVNAGSLSTVVVQNNLFYLSSYSAYQIVVRVANDNSNIPDGLTATVNNNFCNAESGVVTQTWKAFMSNEVGDGNQQITRGKQDMFETLDFENLLFVPIEEYAAYGAQQ